MLWSYLWDFGDDTISTNSSPSHTYSNPGEYTVTLTITLTPEQCWEFGETYTVTKQYYVSVFNPYGITEVPDVINRCFCFGMGNIKNED